MPVRRRMPASRTRRELRAHVDAVTLPIAHKGGTLRVALNLKREVRFAASEGNTIFITGGGSGIGRGLAEAFHRSGNRVIIGGRRREILERTAAENPGMETIQIDTSNRESIRAATAEAIRQFPDINVVVNNAGVQRVIDFASDEPVDEAAFQQEVDTNIYGVLRVTTAF